MITESLDDLAAVRRVIQLDIERANGDGARLREAFHPDARVYGHTGDLETSQPIADSEDHFSLARDSNGRGWTTNNSYGHTG